MKLQTLKVAVYAVAFSVLFSLAGILSRGVESGLTTVVGTVERVGLNASGIGILRIETAQGEVVTGLVDPTTTVGWAPPPLGAQVSVRGRKQPGGLLQINSPRDIQVLGDAWSRWTPVAHLGLEMADSGRVCFHATLLDRGGWDSKRKGRVWRLSASGSYGDSIRAWSLDGLGMEVGRRGTVYGFCRDGLFIVERWRND